MKKAIIYVRVSTDEQKEKGYSLQHQEERLRQYCQINKIDIVGFYQDDHSAKTFERPAFKQLLAFLKRSGKSIDVLLFLKWDRFSRNAADAYGMISRLHKLGVDPQAIEQPLDLNVPENKIMLAFYLAAPEVENERRALNVLAGMRRSSKEGRYCTVAPKGYRNIRTENGKPLIVPDQNAHLVRWVFEEVAKGIHAVQDVWRMATAKGLKVARSNIWYVLRNHLYYGKILIPAYKDEPAALVKGLHEPLISEELFYQVQDVLDGKKRKVPSKNTAREELPLRGFLKCPKCGANLTGSSSRGNGGLYFYYHCNIRCKQRVPAVHANDKFVELLSSISANTPSILLFEAILKDLSKQTSHDRSRVNKELASQIEKNNQRLKNAQQLMLDGEITPADYRDIKSQIEPETQRLACRQSSLLHDTDNLRELIEPCVRLLKHLPDYYSNASLPTKQALIGSIYPEKLIFENNQYRTTRVNQAVSLICRLPTDPTENKNGQNHNLKALSEEVTPSGFKPETF